MQYETFEVGSFAVNCSIVSCSGKTYIVDPGQDSSFILGKLRDAKAVPSAILITHAHFDHIGAVNDIIAAFPGIKVYLHSADAKIIDHPMNQYPPDYPSVKKFETISNFSELDGIKVIETPGHTPGGVCYYFENDGVLFSGDTLFAASIGRTDLPGGDARTLMKSLEKLKVLPRNVKVVPGHGGSTTIGRELDSNPFLI